MVSLYHGPTSKVPAIPKLLQRLQELCLQSNSLQMLRRSGLRERWRKRDRVGGRKEREEEGEGRGRERRREEGGREEGEEGRGRRWKKENG